MNVQLFRDELQHVLSGKSSVRFGGTIQSISGHLVNGQGTSEAIEDQKLFKKQEEERLIEFIRTNNLWLNDIDFSQYVSEFITRPSPFSPIFAPNNAVPSLRLARGGKSGLQWAPHPVKSGGFMPETA